MAKHFECPKCGADISDSYESAEPDVGIMSSGFYCEVCDIAYAAEEDDYEA
jgi:transcription elongation factor Elf1